MCTEHRREFCVHLNLQGSKLASAVRLRRRLWSVTHTHIRFTDWTDRQCDVFWSQPAIENSKFSSSVNLLCTWLRIYCTHKAVHVVYMYSVSCILYSKLHAGLCLVTLEILSLKTSLSFSLSLSISPLHLHTRAHTHTHSRHNIDTYSSSPPPPPRSSPTAEHHWVQIWHSLTLQAIHPSQQHYTTALYTLDTISTHTRTLMVHGTQCIARGQEIEIVFSTTIRYLLPPQIPDLRSSFRAQHQKLYTRTHTYVRYVHVYIYPGLTPS